MPLLKPLSKLNVLEKNGKEFFSEQEKYDWIREVTNHINNLFDCQVMNNIDSLVEVGHRSHEGVVGAVHKHMFEKTASLGWKTEFVISVY